MNLPIFLALRGNMKTVEISLNNESFLRIVKQSDDTYLSERFDDLDNEYVSINDKNPTSFEEAHKIACDWIANSADYIQEYLENN